jgi:hypothetical protein
MSRMKFGRWQLALIVGLIAGWAAANASWAILDRGARGPGEPIAFAALEGDWEVTVRMRDDPSAAWSEFKTTARLERLFDGNTLRERPLDSSQAWSEQALMRWDPDSRTYTFEHVFAGKLSLLQMRGVLRTVPGTLHWTGAWHRQRGEEVSRSPASGTLSIEGDGRHVWQLDEHREDGSAFVDLEMIYERR